MEERVDGLLLLNMDETDFQELGILKRKIDVKLAAFCSKW